MAIYERARAQVDEARRRGRRTGTQLAYDRVYRPIPVRALVEQAKNLELLYGMEVLSHESLYCFW